MHRRNHKTRKASRKLRYTKRKSLRRQRRKQRGGMAASVMSPEGIPVALQGANTYTTVIKKVGGVPTVMSYDTYAKDYKGRDEDMFD
jgi:hypothetical protein